MTNDAGRASEVIKVALVTPVFNRREITLQGLRSLERIDKTGLDVRIVVVDDGSSDGTGEKIRECFPNVHLVEGDGTLHYAAGTNRGISAALDWGAEYVVALNDDAVFHRNFLQSLIKTALQHPRTVVGSLLLLWNEPHRAFQVCFRWNTLRGGWVARPDLTLSSFRGGPIEVEVLTGNCLLYPRQAIESCGLMDEKHFPLGWGDVQYTMRMRKAGWQLLVDPGSMVWCEPNAVLILRQKSLRELFRILFIDRRYAVNLHQLFVARWYSAPNRLKGVMSFFFYFASMLRKAIYYRVKGGNESSR